jgi:hypothetical protein
MFANAQEALEWLRARGYPALPQPSPMPLPFGGKRAQAVQEFALLVKAERDGELPLHIYWMRVATGFSGVAVLVTEYAKKYEQLLPLFWVCRERSVRVWVAYPDPTAKSGYRNKSQPLDPHAKELLEALRYDSTTSHEKHWLRIRRVITGEDSMYAQRIDEAFEGFLAELHDILSEVQNAIKTKTEEGDFQSVAGLAQQAEQINQLIQKVGVLRRDWASPAVHPAPSTPRKRRRTRASGKEMNPQSAYNLPILQALEKLGGRAKAQEVLDKVYELVRDRLLPGDKEVLLSVNEPRWRNAAQWARNRLKERGYLRSDSPKGIWEITDAGRAYLKQLQPEETGD